MISNYRAWDEEMKVMQRNLSWAELATVMEHCTNFKVMKDSGLTDNDGVRIFEGDIVKGEGSEGVYYAPVIFRDCRFTIDPFYAVQVKNPDGWVDHTKKLFPDNKEIQDAVKTYGFIVHWGSDGYHTLKTGWSKLKVIGNIYENHDLLIKKEE